MGRAGRGGGGGLRASEDENRIPTLCTLHKLTLYPHGDAPANTVSHVGASLLLDANRLSVSSVGGSHLL